MLRSLFWKEWHEQRWKVLFGSVLAAGYVAVGLKTRILPDDAILVSCTGGAAFLLPILAAMDLVAAERADRSLSTLVSLPVRSWVVLAVKTIVGSLICVVPQAVAMLAAILIAGGRELPASRFVAAFAGGTALGLCLLIWTVSLGIRQSSEARVALVGLVVVALWIFVFPLIWDNFQIMLGSPQVLLAPAWTGISPIGFLVIGVGVRVFYLTHIICTQLVAGAGLFVWAASRLGQPGRTRG